MVFPFAKSKGDKFGKNADKLCYVYATPNYPTNFLVLYLSWCIFSNSVFLLGGVENNGQ